MELSQMTPRIIFTHGVYRSATTWLFNVSTELERKHHLVATGYTDSLEELKSLFRPSADSVVVKSHIPDDELISHIANFPAKTITAVREPLDCVASLMRQFYMDFEESLHLVSLSCSAVLDIIERCDPLILKYETDARDAATIKSLASFLSIDLDDEVATELALRFSPDSVRSKIEEVMRINSFDGSIPRLEFDPVTHWHSRHLGEGRAGLYKDELGDAQIDAVKILTGNFRNRFHYFG